MALERSDSIRNKFLNPDSNEVLLVAHRGDWRNFAENSLEGICGSIKNGVDIVEIDIQRTLDGELILMHDRSIDRTTTGKGKVEELTMDSIRRVFLRSGIGEPTPYRVPMLYEALLEVKGKVLINLDKAFDYLDQVLEIAEQTGTLSQIILKSGDPADVVKQKMGKYFGQVLYMPVVNLDKPGAFERIEAYCQSLNPPAIEFIYRDLTNELPVRLKDYLSGKCRIWYNSLWPSLCGGHDDFLSVENPDRGFGYLVDSLGASIIQTDQTLRLAGYLYDRGYRRSYIDPVSYGRCLRIFNKAVRQKSESLDWAGFQRYEKANEDVLTPPNVVFIGNSISDRWVRYRPEFFEEYGVLGRGISGQTSSQMLVRFQSDVVNLKPKAVVILAGTNDIALNNGFISLPHIMQNIKSMAQLASVNGIQPIIASVLPAAKYNWRPTVCPAEEIKKLNDLLQSYALEAGIPYVDYYSALTDGKGGLPTSLSDDGCHPNSNCYEIMEKVVLKHIIDYLK